MKSDAMRNIIQKVDKILKLSDMTVLEFFAREGDWQTLDYVDHIKELHAWEIDPQYEPNLRNNLPDAKVRIGDSYTMARELQFKEKFDFIVLDNPQNVFGPYCEHFEALPLVKDLFKPQRDLLLIFNINKHPFNFDAHVLWKKRRNEYYGVDNTGDLKLDFLDDFYHKKFQSMGFEIKDSFNEARDSQYLYYKVFVMRKKS